jgi:outer membrane protein assembly factor BamB
MRSHFTAACLPFFCSVVACHVSAVDWPAWRGPKADGSTTETAFPTHWSPTNQIRWRVDLPDRGNSTPIVVGGKVFITQAVEKDGRRFVAAYDRQNGQLLWEKGTVFEGKEETHEDNPYAAGSPVSDGERVVASFGSAGVMAFGMDGRELWRRDLGPQQHQWGHAASPVILGDRVFVYHGPGPGTRVVAFDKRDGKVLWEKPLPEPVPTQRTDGFKGRLPGVIGSFSTPLAVRMDGREEVILSLPESLVSVSAETGSELWRSGGLNPLVYTSPFLAGQTVIAMGGFSGSTVAVRVGGTGDVTSSHRVWREERSRKNRLGSAVVKDDTLYVFNMDGFLECVDLRTGEQLWEERLNGPGAADASWSSVTLAGDRIYTVNRSGDTFIVRASRKFEVIATNTVAEPSNSSLAMSDGELFLRTWKGLWCISEKGRLASVGGVSR